MRYEAYIRDLDDGSVLSDIENDNIKICWELAFSTARYWRRTSFQIIDTQQEKKYSRFYVE